MSSLTKNVGGWGFWGGPLALLRPLPIEAIPAVGGVNAKPGRITLCRHIRM